MKDGILDKNNVINEESIYSPFSSIDIFSSKGEIFINSKSAKMVNEGVNVIVVDIKEEKIVDIRGFDVTRIKI